MYLKYEWLFISNLGGNADILRPINLGRSFFYYKKGVDWYVMK